MVKKTGNKKDNMLKKPINFLADWRPLPLSELMSYILMYASVPMLAYGIQTYDLEIMKIILLAILTMYSGFFAALIWNDITDEDIGRIIEYNLSPLYVSVHSTEETIREKLFGRPLKNSIIETLERLTSSGIIVHSQAVLVPGLNDGNVLEKTANDLFRLYPGVKSLALVPVGLTKHRENLSPLERFDPDAALKVVDFTAQKQREIRKVTGNDSFIYPSDEFYLLSGKELPDNDEYGVYDQ